MTAVVPGSWPPWLSTGGFRPGFQQYTTHPNANAYETCNRLDAQVSNLAFTSGVMRNVPIALPQGITISNIGCLFSAAANTPQHWWFSLLDNTNTFLRSTADQTTTAQPAEALLPLTSPFVTTYTGLYYLGNMQAFGVASPTIFGRPSILTTLTTLAPALGGTSGAAMTTPPANGTSNGGIGPLPDYPYMYVT